MGECLLRAVDLERTYRRGPQEVRALDGVTLDVTRGEFVGVVGASGSGKSTLLNLLAGLDTPTSGRIEVDGVDLASLDRRRRAAYRARRVGMVFQSFHLLPHMTALENVEIALCFVDAPRRGRRARAAGILERLGLGERLGHRPSDLSGGEQQRVAIARALVKDPEVLFADEPTGNLDHGNADEIAGLLTRLNADGLTIVMASHNLEMTGRCSHRQVRMDYGRIVAETRTPRGQGGER